MGRSVNEPQVSASAQHMSEWTIDTARHLSRELRGTELMVRASELVHDGNFQLDLLGEFDTTLSSTQLQSRYQAAWWLVRQKFPVVGVSLAEKKAHFEPILTMGAAQQWVSQTCFIESNTTGEALLLAQCRQASDKTRLTIILDPSRGSRACVLNISHTLISQGVWDIIRTFVDNLARDDCNNGLEGIFSPEDIGRLPSKLPQSLSNAYSSQLPAPTEAQRHKAVLIQQKAQDRWGLNSIGIPIHSEHQTRQSWMHNKQIRVEDADFRAALVLAKTEGITITSLFFACITAGIHRRYSNGSEDGAHLVFSGNARRWIKTDGEAGEPPVALSIVPGAMWLDKTCLQSDLNDKASLLRLAKDIHAVQEDDMASEHIIGVYNELAPVAANAVLETQNAHAVFPATCRPTLTSQGAFLSRGASPASSKDESQSVTRVTNFRTGGRNTSSTVCFALYSFNKELRCNMLFDERFFDQDEMMQLMYIITGLFRRMIGQVGQSAGSKL